MPRTRAAFVPPAHVPSEWHVRWRHDGGPRRQESAYEAFLDEGEDQAAAAWVSDDDVFDGHYSDY